MSLERDVRSFTNGPVVRNKKITVPINKQISIPTNEKIAMRRNNKMHGNSIILLVLQNEHWYFDRKIAKDFECTMYIFK